MATEGLAIAPAGEDFPSPLPSFIYGCRFVLVCLHIFPDSYSEVRAAIKSTSHGHLLAIESNSHLDPAVLESKQIRRTSNFHQSQKPPPSKEIATVEWPKDLEAGKHKQIDAPSV